MGWSQGPPYTCLQTYPTCSFGYTSANVWPNFDGVVLPRFPVKLKEIEDGTSNTILVGEKFVYTDYYQGDDGGYKTNSCADNNPVFNGYDWDNIRWTRTAVYSANNAARAANYTPQQDFPRPPLKNDGCSERFGSAHAGGFNAAFCDGSVRNISYDVDPNEYQLLGMRSDGGAVPK